MIDRDDSVQLPHHQQQQRHNGRKYSNITSNTTSFRLSHNIVNNTSVSTSLQHHQPLTNSFDSSSKMHPRDATPVDLKQQSIHPYRHVAGNNRNNSTNSSSRYKNFRVIMILIAIATICNIYTSSYLLKQRTLFSSFESNIYQNQFQYTNETPIVSSSNIKSTRLKTYESTILRHESRRTDVDTGSTDDKWTLPISMIETVIQQSNDYHKTHQRRLVICATNYEYIDFADNFVHSLIRNNVTNFLIVPLDTIAYNTLRTPYPNNTVPTFPTNVDDSNEYANDKMSGSSSSRFGSAAFRQITASRPNFLRQIIEQLHVTIFYNDIDMVWKYDAWDMLDERIHFAEVTPLDELMLQEIENVKLRRNSNIDDRMTPTREYKSKETLPLEQHGSSATVTTLLWHDGPGLICTCMMYITPTINNIRLLQEWENEILHDETGMYLSDQDAFVAYIEKTKFIEQSQQVTTYAIVPSMKVTTSNGSNTTDSRIDVIPPQPPYMTILYRNDDEFPHGHKYDWYNQSTTTSISTTTTINQSTYTATNDRSLRQRSKKRTDFLYNPNDAIIVHNNWIKGKVAKFKRFQSSGLWNPSGLLLSLSL